MKGFTLIETMVAVTILALAVVGPMRALQIAYTNAFMARDQLVAASLAQEGLEFIHAWRDNNYLIGPPTTYLQGLATCQTPAGCAIDAIGGTVSAAGAPLRLTTTGFYRQTSTSGDTVTRFTRTIQITLLAPVGVGNNEARVTSTVTWRANGGTFTTVLTENLRDWL